MRPSRYAFPAALLCAAGLSIGLCFCVITSFAVPADPVRLLLACFLAAALFSAVFLLKKSWIWLLVVLLLAGAGGYLLRAELRQSLSALVYAVSSNYADAIPGLQAVSLTEDASGVDATLVLILIAALYALLCSWTVMRGEHLAYLLAGVLPVLVLCLVILQTPPAAWAILLVVGVLALLLLSQLLRARQESEGNRLALLLAVPLALLVGLLAVLFPAKTYEREKWSDSLQQTLADAADKLTLFRRDAQTGQVRFTSPISPSTLGSYLWDSSVTGVNLNRVGPQRQYGRTVMRVQGQTSGLCHLRGDSLAVYEENRWKALSERDYAEAGDAVSALTAGAVRIAASEEEEAGFSAVSAAYSMSIETEMKSGVYYTPYYPLTLPEGAAPYHDAYIRNSSQRTSYAVLYTDAHTDVPDETYEAFVHETYTQVPDQTRQALADILPQLGVQPGDDPHRILAAVQSYVSSSARYDLNTPAVPDGEDFVSWFLHESETGYCVHFATAAAILLRCMDVPARYVTGFSTNVTAGSWTTVTTDDAHAWVEYYVDGLGWYVLDPTPAMQDSHILTLQPDNSSETDPAPTQEENQVQQVPETSTTETTPDAPEVSPETSDKPTETNQESSKTFHFFRYLWPILAAAAALLIWRALLFSIRRAAIGQGSGNRRAVTLYHHICWLARRTKTEVPAEFLEVAEKARFSHHKLSREELQPLQDHADQLTRQLLADKRFWRQFLYRVIYALG